MRMKPASFTSAAKLETQNGIRNSRKICQRSSRVVPRELACVLNSSAAPMIALNPNEVSHSRGLASK